MTSPDKLIPVVAFVFAASMVSERIANLLKLYIPAFLHAFKAISQTLGIPLAWKKTTSYFLRKKPSLCRLCRHINRHFQFKKTAFVWENLHLKQSDVELETIRERIVLFISMITGIGVAMLFKTELMGALDSLGSDSPEATNKEDVDNSVSLWVFTGFGILFSFGSKFWHDTLDLLFFTKNIRRRLGDVNLDEIESADQLSTYLQTSNAALVKKAIEENETWLRRDFPGAIRTMVSDYRLIGSSYQNCVVIYLIGPRPAQFPLQLPVSGSTGKIPVYVIENLGPVVAHGRPGDQIDRGTFGCMVQKSIPPNDYYILTCAHVVTGRRANFDPAELSSLQFNIDPDTNLGVRADNFRFNYGYDCALIGPIEKDKHSNDLFGDIPIQGVRGLTNDDKDKKIELRVCVNSDNYGEHTGKLIEHSHADEVVVEYDDGTKKFTKLILIESNTPLYKFTAKGDSGAIVYDQDYYAIGLIIGGDDHFSYALPIKEVLSQFTAEISIQKILL